MRRKLRHQDYRVDYYVCCGLTHEWAQFIAEAERLGVGGWHFKLLLCMAKLRSDGKSWEEVEQALTRRAS